MAISLRAAGTMTDEVAAANAINPAYPAGLQANDVSILMVTVKPYTTTITTPSGWTKLGEKTSGTRASTQDAGSVKIALYYRIGSFSGSLGNLTLSGATDGQAVINSYQCGAGETWTVTYTDGAQTSVVTNYSATGAANLSLASGDWLIAGCCASHLQNSGAYPGSETLTATGATLGTLNARQEYFNYANNNIWSLYWDRSVSSGTSSAAPVQTWTWTTTQEGATGFVRLRVTASSTPVSGSDTASGTDNAGTLAATSSSTDTGSGTDSAGVVKQTSADTGTGTDNAGSVARTASSADTGSGADSAGSLTATSSSADTGTGTDNAGTAAFLYTGADTGTGTESAGSVAQKFAGTDTGSGTESSGSLAGTSSSADTVAGTEAQSVSTASSSSDTGTGTDNAGSVGLAASETALGTEAQSAPTAAIANAETAPAAEAVSFRTLGAAETGTGTDSPGGTLQTKSGSDTVSSADDDHLTRPVSAPGDAFTWIEGVGGRRLVNFDNPTTTEVGNAVPLADVPKSGSETVTRVEAQTLALPGAFSQIPSPKVWENGDDLYAGTLNKEWRDAFNWLLRRNSPAFEAYNGDGASLSITKDAGIALKVEELKQGNLTHATNDSKVYVWEDGWYLAWVQVGTAASGSGATFASELLVNGNITTTCDTTRVAGSPVVIEHLSSVYLTAGDYVEIALGGSFSGSGTSVALAYAYPVLGLWWRNN